MGYAEEKRLKALCFDIDGTFYPKWQTHIYLFKAALAHPIFSARYNSMRQKMRAQDGREVKTALPLSAFRKKESLLLYGKVKDAYEEKYEKCLFAPWQKYSRNLKCFPYVKEALLKAKEQGYILAALSDFPIGNKLETLGLDGLFDFVASTEDYGYLKPNATALHEMLKELGVNPQQALYTGDSYKKDILGGNGLGMHTCLICRGEDRSKAPVADLVLTGWDKFINIVL